MTQLNYHHLQYFFVVAREHGVTAAAEALGVSQPTVSAQLRQLEEMLGGPLFRRTGRKLVLTEMGQVVQRYAEHIFGLGQEMLDTLAGRPAAGTLRLRVGIADVLPKLVARRLLEPALAMAESVQLVCYEGKPIDLVSRLVAHDLDVVLSDAPHPAYLRGAAFNHLLGESGVGIFGVAQLIGSRRGAFPRCLDGAPLLLPGPQTALRRALDHWLESRGLRPRTIAEIEDSALLKTFGQAGHGLFPAPAVVSGEVCRQYGVRQLGELEGLRAQFFAISVERKVKHPGVLAISQGARAMLQTD